MYSILISKSWLTIISSMFHMEPKRWRKWAFKQWQCFNVDGRTWALVYRLEEIQNYYKSMFSNWKPATLGILAFYSNKHITKIVQLVFQTFSLWFIHFWNVFSIFINAPHDSKWHPVEIWNPSSCISMHKLPPTLGILAFYSNKHITKCL